MQMYVNFFDRHQRSDHEAPTIGIVLCSEKNDAMATITLSENNEQILAARYQMYLPTEPSSALSWHMSASRPSGG
jgi:YhcG PDDEXK nuclease domain